MKPENPISPEKHVAVLFDLDGVLTATAKVHAAAWKQTFDPFLERWSREHDQPFQPFDIVSDYKHHVDGKSRYDGVRSFLQARGIEIPEGTMESPGTEPSVCGLGNRKDELVNTVLSSHGVEVYPGSIRLVETLRQHGIKTGVVSSSRNCLTVLQTAGIEPLFDTRVDGTVADEMELPGKPNPDMFLLAARRLGATPDRAVVVEDAIAGVRAGRAGRFALVIGIARGGEEEALRAAGADLVVNDLGELI